jgi:hypothetical protein
MEKELKKMHDQAMKKQLDAAGFPADLIEGFLEDFSPASGKRVSWSFETQMDQMKVKGKMHAEPTVSGGMYALDYYQLTLCKRLPGEKPGVPPVPGNKFLCTPWSWIRLDEAVNLMQGRYVYRKPDSDPTGEGYWLYLTGDELLEGFRKLGFVRIPFDVSNALAETGLGGWLGLTGWVRLVDSLERGCCCDLVIGTGAGMTAIKVQADPRGRRLLLFDIHGKEQPLEKLLKRKHHGNLE